MHLFVGTECLFKKEENQTICTLGINQRDTTTTANVTTTTTATTSTTTSAAATTTTANRPPPLVGPIGLVIE